MISYPSEVQRLRRYHLQERISISDIADHIGLSPNYLNYLFKKETGQTIKQYQDRYFRTHPEWKQK